MNERLIIPELIYEEMVSHCQQNLPYEGCGFLSGKYPYVQNLWKLKNEVPSSHRFFLSRKVVTDTIKKAEEVDEDILAIYHSHPTTSAIPSHYDCIHHPDPEVNMVIVSFKYPVPEVKGYQIYNHKHFPVNIHIDE